MSETPPPYYRPQAQKKSNSNTILIIVLICVVVIPCVGLLALGAMGYSFFKNVGGPMVGCMITFDTANKAVSNYVTEKGAYPKAETWQDEVQPYYAKILEAKKDEMAMFSPAKPEGVWTCKGGEPQTGIAFNSELSGKKPADIKDKLSKVVIFEVADPKRNAHAVYERKSKETSPKFMGNPRGWMYVTIDGDVQGFEGGSNSGFRME